MGAPAAKAGDRIVAMDIHIELVPTPLGEVPMPIPNPFEGIIDGNLSENVQIMGMPAATAGSTATNDPAHMILPPGDTFEVPPENTGEIMMGSATVLINGKPAARAGDIAQT